MIVPAWVAYVTLFVGVFLLAASPGLLRLFWTCAYLRGRRDGQSEALRACEAVGHARRSA